MTHVMSIVVEQTPEGLAVQYFKDGGLSLPAAYEAANTVAQNLLRRVVRADVEAKLAAKQNGQADEVAPEDENEVQVYEEETEP